METYIKVRIGTIKTKVIPVSIWLKKRHPLSNLITKVVRKMEMR